MHILGLLFVSLGLAEITWAAKSSAPSARYGAKAVLSADQTTVYLVGGYNEDGDVLQDAWKLSLAQGFAMDEPAWKQIDDLPLGVAYPSIAALGNKIYAIGGILNDSDDSACETAALVQVYDTDKQAWTLAANHSDPVRRMSGGAFTVDEAIYNFGGQSACFASDSDIRVYNQIDVFHTNNATWSTLNVTGSPVAERNFGLWSDGTNVFVSGGEAAKKDGRRTYVDLTQWAAFNTESDSWTYLSAAGFGSVDARAGHLMLGYGNDSQSSNKSMYILGGSVDGDAASPGMVAVTLEGVNLSANDDSDDGSEKLLSDTESTSQVKGLEGLAGVMLPDGTAIFGFGRYANGTIASNTLLSFDVSSGKWKTSYEPTTTIKEIWKANEASGDGDSSSSQTRSNSADGGSRLSKGKLAAIIACSTLGVFMLAGLLCLCYWRRYKRRQTSPLSDKGQFLAQEKTRTRRYPTFGQRCRALFGMRSRSNRISRMLSVEPPDDWFADSPPPQRGDEAAGDPEMMLPAWASAHAYQETQPQVPPHRIWPRNPFDDPSPAQEAPPHRESSSASSSLALSPVSKRTSGAGPRASTIYEMPERGPHERDEEVAMGRRMVQVATLDRGLSFTVPRMKLRVVNASMSSTSSDLISLDDAAASGSISSSISSSSSPSNSPTGSSVPRELPTPPVAHYGQKSVSSQQQGGHGASASAATLHELIGEHKHCTHDHSARLHVRPSHAHRPSKASTTTSTSDLSAYAVNPFENDAQDCRPSRQSTGIDDTATQVWRLLKQKQAK